MTTLTRYTLLQIPGWVIMAVLLVGLHLWIGLSFWVAAALFAGWIAKDFVLYPFVHPAYETNVKTGSEQLVGAKGVAHQRLAPEGYVQVHGELWRAKVEPRDRPIAPGTPVRVQAAHDLTLIVVAEGADEDKAMANYHIFSPKE